MADSKVKAGDIWDEPEIFCSARKWGTKTPHSDEDRGTTESSQWPKVALIGTKNIVVDYISIK